MHLNGKLIPVFKKADVQVVLEGIGVCASAVQLKEKAAESNETAPNAKRLAQMKADEETRQKKVAIAARETSSRISLYKQFRVQAANGLSLQSLRAFVKLVLTDDNSYCLPDDILWVFRTNVTSDSGIVTSHSI